MDFMNKKAKITSFLLVVMMIFMIISSTNVEAASKVKINKTKTTIYVGKTETLKISGTKKNVKWTTSNKKVATVSSKGKVTAKKAGSATITAKVSGKSYKCKVTVKKPYINRTSKTLYVSDTYTLKLTGTTIKTVKSSNPKIATINTKGKVTAKKAGNTTITLTGKDKKSYKCNITVKEKAHVHSYIQKVIEPTCTEKGYTLYTCSCGYSYKDNYQNVTGHIWNDWKVIKEATETEKGIELRTCSVCNENESRDIPVKEHMHDYKPVVTPPTCTEKGYTTYTCSCGDSYISDYTEATHEWSDWVIIKDAGTEVHTSVEQFGERVATCTVCGEKKTQTIINVDASAFDEDNEFSVAEPNFICDGIVQVYGTFYRDMAYETLALVNELRTSLGLNELTWCDKFYDICNIRASELSVTFAHERPNGTKSAYVNSTGFSIKLVENIQLNASYVDAQDAYQGWHDSTGHYANMISDDIKDYYASCFEDEYGGFYWVQLFY